MTTPQAPEATRECSVCKYALHMAGASTMRCPRCGHWVRLPRSLLQEMHPEAPAELPAAAEHEARPPWREVSPAIGLVFSIVFIIFAISVTSLALMILGFAMALACFFAAAVLQFRIEKSEAIARGEGSSVIGQIPNNPELRMAMRGGGVSRERPAAGGGNASGSAADRHNR